MTRPGTLCEWSMPGLQADAPGSWFAAAGLLRMASRADPQARLRWLDSGTPVLTGTTDLLPAVCDELPWTPVITPWQSGGGWGEKDKTPRDRIAAIRTAPSLRMEPLRDAIQVAGAVLTDFPGAGKDDLVRLLRNRLPEDALPWLDAAVPLRSQPGNPGTLKIEYGPLLLSGGNDGRWDLSTNYHGAILALDPPRSSAEDARRRRAWLDDLTEGTEHESLADLSAGPYWPVLSAPPIANPWSLVLLAEGLCLFGDSGHVHPFGSLGQPWTSKAGPDWDGEPGWGEIWLPMWDGPLTAGEVRLLLRDQPLWRGKPAVSAADMYASLNALGWPRGILGYARYAMARRKGLAHQAVLLDMLIPGSLPDLSASLSAGEAAAMAGVGQRTWTSYVARGQAPPPDLRDARTGKPLWHAGTVSRYLLTRPGQGARTDKTAKTPAGNGETGEPQ